MFNGRLVAEFGADRYDNEVVSAMEGAPAGAGGLVLVPYFEGERTPNRPDATGAPVPALRAQRRHEGADRTRVLVSWRGLGRRVRADLREDQHDRRGE